MTKRYPATPVTPHGWYHLVKGDSPQMWLDAYDKSITFDLSGGLAAPYNGRQIPESVALQGLKGLIPPWKHIMQKGATQDGSTHVDALLDPTEVGLDVVCRGRDWRHTNRVSRELLDSIDAIQQSKLNFWTHDMGHWWADVRWFQGAPQNPINLTKGGQKWGLRLLADTACWRTYDWTSMFSFTYEDMTATTFDAPLTGWPQYRYEGIGTGGPVGTGDGVRWDEDGTAGISVMLGPYAGFDTATTNQVVNVVIGSLMEFGFLDAAFLDIWGRCGRDGNDDWDGTGIRARIGMGRVILTAFVNFAEVWERQWLKPIPPVFGEKFTLVCGFEDEPRKFQIQRNGIPILTHVESGTDSVVDASHRGIGMGMRAGTGLFTQASPPYIRKISAGDNAQVSQSGFVPMVNIGDQKMYWDATLFGPFEKVRLYDGPGSSESVEFGPLLKNQIVFLRTDPRSNTTLVQDLTSTPPTPQELNIFQQATKTLLSFFSDQNAFTDQISSLFGIRAPQGNFYKYLSGRFSDNAAIPAKSPGDALRDVKPYHVKVEIDGGNADSKVILSGTPLRRSPL